MKQYKHLTKDERNTIERLLSRGLSLKAIGRELNRSCDTVSREVRRNAMVKRTGAYGAAFNNCAHKESCQEYDLCSEETCRRKSCRNCAFCFRFCPLYERVDCPKPQKPPYVCNGCDKRSKCTLEKFVYRASEAHRIYKETLSGSREGINISKEELVRLDDIISPLLKKGQSPHAICVNNKDAIMLDEKTVYRYVKSGLFTARPLDLPRLVRMRPRRKKKPLKVDRSCRRGRTHTDFLAFLEQNPDIPIVEMDSVEGKKGVGEKVLLTIHFTESHLMLAFLRDANTARSVTEIFNDLYLKLGQETFQTLFQLCLTDNGSEFSDPAAIERDPDGNLRARVFYCDPSAPYQKGAIENNHSLLRRIIPKGISLNRYTQEDINLAINHINSYSRKKLNDRSPYQCFSFFHSTLVLEKLGVRYISPNEINLTPDLLKR